MNWAHDALIENSLLSRVSLAAQNKQHHTFPHHHVWCWSPSTLDFEYCKGNRFANGGGWSLWFTNTIWCRIWTREEELEGYKDPVSFRMCSMAPCGLSSLSHNKNMARVLPKWSFMRMFLILFYFHQERNMKHLNKEKDASWKLWASFLIIITSNNSTVELHSCVLSTGWWG